VGGAAGPVGGDHLELDVEVGSGATLTLRTAAASVAYPGVNDEESTLVVRVHVGEEAALRWLPEPSVAARGCRHHLEVRLSLAVGSSVTWREELILGRHGEEPGWWEASTFVDLDGVPLWRQELHIASGLAGWQGPAVLGDNRAVGSLLMVEPSWAGAGPESLVLADTAAVLPLSGPAAVVSALADDAFVLRQRLDEGWRCLTRQGSAVVAEQSPCRPAP